jgi:hypothetical protein
LISHGPDPRNRSRRTVAKASMAACDVQLRA